MDLFWLAPSFGGGSALAYAVVPTCPPSDVFQNRGTRCTPGGGCAPCTLLGEMRTTLSTGPTLRRFWVQGGTLYPRRGLRPLHPARRRSRACVGASAALPHLLPSMERGQPLIVVSEFFSRISGVSGTEASRSHRASIASHRGSIADPSRTHRASIAYPSLAIAHPSRLQEVCLATAFAPAPGFPGGLRAWGTSPRGALPQGRLGGCHWRRR